MPLVMYPTRWKSTTVLSTLPSSCSLPSTPMMAMLDISPRNVRYVLSEEPIFRMSQSLPGLKLPTMKIAPMAVSPPVSALMSMVCQLEGEEGPLFTALSKKVTPPIVNPSR